MRRHERIPEELFREDSHYLGRPADPQDRIVHRRIRLVEQIPGFMGKQYSLLDIGCGNGTSMFLLSGKMKKCVGLDITDAHKSAFDEYKATHNLNNCEFRQVDVVKTEPREQFDRIISFEVIEHLSDESAMAFFYDSLKDNGIMAVSVPNKWWLFETHGAKLPLLPWNRVPFFSWLPRPIHERYANARIYTKRRIERLLERYGFEVLQSHYVTAPMDVLPDGTLKRWLVRNVFREDTTRVPCKAVSIFVVARKRSRTGALEDGDV